jgi:hypothetical protein
VTGQCLTVASQEVPHPDGWRWKAGKRSLTVAPQCTAMVTLPAPLLPATETVTGT